MAVIRMYTDIYIHKYIQSIRSQYTHPLTHLASPHGPARTCPRWPGSTPGGRSTPASRPAAVRVCVIAYTRSVRKKSKFKSNIELYIYVSIYVCVCICVHIPPSFHTWLGGLSYTPQTSVRRTRSSAWVSLATKPGFRGRDRDCYGWWGRRVLVCIFTPNSGPSVLGGGGGFGLVGATGVCVHLHTNEWCGLSDGCVCLYLLFIFISYMFTRGLRSDGCAYICINTHTGEGVVVGEDGGLGVALVGRHGVVLVDDGDDALFGWVCVYVMYVYGLLFLVMVGGTMLCCCFMCLFVWSRDVCEAFVIGMCLPP